MKQNEKISVIIPVYNVSGFIGKCIDSILNQTYSNFEIILVNDGSKDNSLKICHEYEKRDNRIIVIDKKNEGAGMARNAGLDIAKGEYIVFVDSDDWIEQTMLEHLFCLITQENSDLSMCNYSIDDEAGNSQIAVPVTNSDICLYTDIAECIAMLDDTGNFPYLWNKLYRRKIIEDNSIRFEQQFITGEDIDFNLKYFKYINSCAMSDKAMYHYIKHGTETLCSRYKPGLYESIIELNKRREKLYVQYSMFETLEYKRVFEKTCVEQINTCIPNMFRTNAPYKTKDRIYLMKLILDDKKLKSYCKNYTTNNSIRKLFKFVIKLNSATIAVLIYSVLFIIRNGNEDIYRKLRGFRSS